MLRADQILTQLSLVTAFVEPIDLRHLVAVFRGTMNALNVVNVFGWLPGASSLSCFGVTRLESKLAVALTPAGLAALVMLTPYGRRRCVKPVVWLTFLLAPALASRAFRALAPCDCFANDGAPPECFLRLDYAVACTPSPDVSDDTGHLERAVFAPGSIRALAWLNIAVYALVPPAVAAWLLWKERLAITLRGPPTTLSNDIALLYDGYNPRLCMPPFCWLRRV